MFYLFQEDQITKNLLNFILQAANIFVCYPRNSRAFGFGLRHCTAPIIYSVFASSNIAVLLLDSGAVLVATKPIFLPIILIGMRSPLATTRPSSNPGK